MNEPIIIHQSNIVPTCITKNGNMMVTTIPKAFRDTKAFVVSKANYNKLLRGEHLEGGLYEVEGYGIKMFKTLVPKF